MKKFTSGLLPGSVRMSQRQYHLDVTWKSEGLLQLQESLAQDPVL